MSEFVTIPKLLPAREPSADPQKIPRIIWQTMKTNEVPAVMKAYADSWIDKNPEYEYRLHDNNDIIEFLKKDFPAYLEGYQKIKYGASKADLWRYLIMYKYGGIYADMDCRCIRPVKQWADPNAAFVTQFGINKDICQWLIMTVPGNPVFLKAAEMTLHNILTNSPKASYCGFELKDNKLSIVNRSPIKIQHEVLGLSGPPVLQEAAEICLKEGLISDMVPYIQVVCVSGQKVSCQMNGNVTHETGDEDYKKALSKLKTPYYDGFLPRLLRKIFNRS